MRDVNGQMHWSWSRAEEFEPRNMQRLAWNADCHALTLRPQAGVAPSQATKPQMRAAASPPPLIVDAYETWARVADEAPGRIEAGGVDRDPETILELDPGQSLRDMDSAAGGDLFVVVEGPEGRHLIWMDLLGRFEALHLDLPGFDPDRVMVAPDGGDVWLLSRSDGTLARVRGTPMPAPIAAFDPPAAAARARPSAADLPRIEPAQITLPDGQPILDAAALAGGRLAILREGQQTGGLSGIDWVAADGGVTRTELNGVTRAFTLAGHGGDRVALAAPDWREARVYGAPAAADDETRVIHPGAERIPLQGWSGARLCKGSAVPGCYPLDTAEGPPARIWARLAALSKPAYARDGTIALSRIDTGTNSFVWHRIYLEADIPKGTQIRITALASDAFESDSEEGTGTGIQMIFGAPVPNRIRWNDGQYEHLLPHGVWVDMPSEHPHGRNHLPDGSERIRDRRGLFTCLLQDTEGSTLRLKGRFLRLQVHLYGSGGLTPRLHAIRVWGPRFSYRDRYLPELYQIETGPGAEGSAFLERYLCLFESFFTPLEGQIAEAWRGASAASAPAEALDWLGGWLGLRPDGALGEAGKRRLIAGAAGQSLWHGTLRGLEMALDTATDGGVRDGRVVVVENFNLRRTFATILGADFDDRDDPLTRGTRGNANSVLGPAFFLGAREQKTLFALLRPEMLEHDLTRPEERAAALDQLEAMEERSAFRVTVLLHDGLDEAERGLVQAVLDREVPAHVRAAVFDAPQSLLLGLSALLGVETRLGPGRAPAPFILGDTELGQAQLSGLPALDPRLEP